MYISEIKEITNYRNLSNLKISFDKTMNFFIGENNIGKTNILELLNKIFSSCKFVETDFYDKSKPIRIVFTIKYDDKSIGFFEDNFDVDCNNSITLIAEQDDIEENISYYHDTSNKTLISNSIIKKINVLYYYAQRLPSKEIGFKQNYGTAKVLNYMIELGLNKFGVKEGDIIQSIKINNIIKEINNSFNKINAITGDSIITYMDSNVNELISRLLMIGDDKEHEFNLVGDGIQYAFNIILQIIEVIYKVKRSKKPDRFNERLICVEDKKYFPLIMLFDEPEIHQHSYRQRYLIKKIVSILNNENNDFIKLLKYLFNIDGLSGQLFISTHSPNILLNDYKQFIRIYRNSIKKELEVISGNNLNLDQDLYKHLLHNYIYLKESMFSKIIIFVEGDTENGAMHVFAERKKIDLDQYGIGVVKLDGADSVLYYMELYKKFEIKTYAIIDSDKKNKYNKYKDIYFTYGEDYEEDIYLNFNLKDYLKCCRELDMLESMIKPIKNIEPNLDVEAFKDNVDILKINEDDAKKLMDNCKMDQLSKLRKSKNAYKGAILAKYVTKIPEAYNKFINVIIKEVNCG